MHDIFRLYQWKIVACSFSDENSPDEVNGVIYSYLLKKMHIASIHNHPDQYCSPPSGENFEIVLDDYTLNKLREKFDNSLNSYLDEVRSDFDEGYLILDNVNEGYGDFLLNYLITNVIKLN